MASQTLASILLFVFGYFLIETNYALRIEIQTDVSSSNVSISCLTDDEGGYGVQQIETMQIQKIGVGKALALVTRKNGQLATKPRSDIEVHGQVDNANITENFLKLTFVLPVDSDSGTYTCVQYFIDPTHTLLQKKASATLVVDGTSQTLKTLYQRMTILEQQVQRQTSKQECSCNDKIAALEKTITEQEEKNLNTATNHGVVKERLDLLEKTTATLSNLIEGLENNVKETDSVCNDCKHGIADNRDKLVNLEETCRNQSEVLTEVTNKVSYSVAFSAYLSDSAVVVEGKTIVFDTTLFNQGQGYNKERGVFTAPADGLYAFQFSAQISKGDRMEGEIRMAMAVNTSSRAKLILDTKKGQQGSVSDVMTLAQGDQVKIVTTSAVKTNIDASDLSLFYDQYTIFSGYLIKRY